MSTGKKSGRPSGLIMKVMLLALAFSLLVASGAYATTTKLFIKFAGIDGESTDVNHKNWSDILSVNWGVSVEAPSHTGGSASKPVFQDLVWNQEVDKIFPKLFDRAAKGAYTDEVFVEFTTINTSQTYFRMEFKNVLFTSLELTGKSGESTTFTGSFAYEKIKMIYTEYDEEGNKKGNIEAQYDLTSNLGSPAELGVLYAMGLSGPRVAVIPLPPSLMLLGSGLLGLVGWRWKLRK